MKKRSICLFGILVLFLQGCAIYTPYGPSGYASPAYGYRSHHHGHDRWRGDGHDWRGYHH